MDDSQGVAGDASADQGDIDEKSETGSVAGYCAQLCEKRHSCDKSRDVQTCANSCKNSFAATGPKLRADFIAGLGECVQHDDCVTVLGDGGGTSCTREALAMLAPSATGIDFCTSYQTAAEKCNGKFDKAACYDSAKTFNDAALLDAQACSSKACSDLGSCVSAALGVASSGSAPTPSSTVKADCSQGANNLCACSPCTSAERTDVYNACLEDDPSGYRKQITCMAQYTACSDIADCID